jgi:hypothetical protein
MRKPLISKERKAAHFTATLAAFGGCVELGRLLLYH